MQSAIFSPPNAQLTPEQQIYSPGQQPASSPTYIPSTTSRDIKYPICLASLGHPSWLLVKNNPVPAKPRTTSMSTPPHWGGEVSEWPCCSLLLAGAKLQHLYSLK